MNDHVAPDRMNEYVEGTLAENEREAVARHLEACGECRADAASIGGLIADLAALPRSIEPPRDLRPDIWRRIDADANGRTVRALPFRQRTLASMRWPLAAAAILLVAITAAITAALLRSRTEPAAEAWAVNEPAPGYMLTLAATYEDAIDELERHVSEWRNDLAPATLRVLEDNLRIIDEALAESRRALEDDPGNSAISRVLMATYEKKLDLLRGASLSRTGL